MSRAAIQPDNGSALSPLVILTLTAMRKQTNPKAHTAARRPYLSFRPSSPDQERRIRRLAEATGKSIGQIIKECLEGHLPKLEAAS